jgi:hypothetical protein
MLGRLRYERLGACRYSKLEELRYGTEVKRELGERAILSQRQKASDEEQTARRIDVEVGGTDAFQMRS